MATPWDPALFSQGQLQLLAIARAVAADPRILLLDEITANLDSGTEALVMEALRRASQPHCDLPFLTVYINIIEMAD